ncbi:D-alanine--poly(phosphoribitol) ligase [Streptomyces bauhiniae]|uniref:D-alanine--poly(Phosphoribitol) ligase n=1 Tax=Streptomyces bauhiniae TaxID=2340725 RepID=A0A4Z1D3W2_9ACTN|nr:amino acid adenylation domain-containing protein [Streptomyces bauhiniae]TGN76716.1 D-alanine--poly(phosphoribitol) ligase [Streptomyces bauhiniae]
MTGREHGTPRELHDWFAVSAQEHADLVALEVGGERLTYRQLDELATALAAEILTAHGGRAPRRVGLTTAPGVLTYAAALAVLRLGAAVVPLNTAFPPARLATIARTAGLELHLTDRAPAPEGPEIPALLLSDDLLTRLRDGRTAPDPLPPAEVAPGDIAYVLFTSGSTGTPKGVPIAHRSMDAFLRYVIDRYALGPGCRMAQNSGLAFDASVLEMFGAWGSGATLVVPPRAELPKPARFVGREGITHWFSVPSVITMADLTGGLTSGSMPSLRWTLFGGEQLTVQQARAWRRAAPHTVIENVYGPTELTILSSQYRLPDRTEDWPDTANGTLPIGEVYPHLDHQVVDEDGRTADVGELRLRGVQRFAGYLDEKDNRGRFLDASGRPVETDGPYVPDEKHWYRTGDLVQVLEGGTLVHLGRLDQQVKIMGQRVEIGEAEAVLREQDDIGQVAVVALRDEDGQTRLEAAYTGTARPAAELRQALSARLPRYMVPHRFTHRTELPLNHNGKLDRRVLADQLAAIRN